MRLHKALFHIMKLVFPKVVFESNGIEIEEPAILVANHEDSYGPIALYLYLPVKTYPWIMYKLTDKAACARFLEEDFVSKDLRLPKPFSTWLALLIADLCRWLFRAIEAIPVYGHSHRIMETISRSIVYLEEGRNLLIFPEIPDSSLNTYIKRFNTGFIELAKKAGRERRKTIKIYPLSVSRRGRTISLGRPSVYDITRPYSEEKARIQLELEAEVTALLEARRRRRDRGR